MEEELTDLRWPECDQACLLFPFHRLAAERRQGTEDRSIIFNAESSLSGRDIFEVPNENGKQAKD